MQDIAELERRITAALERIAKGLDEAIDLAPRGPDMLQPVASDLGATQTLAQPVADTAALEAEIARLTAVLDEEQMANAQLAERLRVVRDKEAKLREALEVQIRDLLRQLDAQGLELSRAHRTMVQQGGQLRSLREAAEAQFADPVMINRTMEVEMEALRATRGAEVAELDDILSALDQMMTQDMTARDGMTHDGGADARA